MPWTCHRVLAVRENPLAAPGDWLDPRFAAHDVPVSEWLAGLGYGEAAIRLGYGLNPTFGEDARAVSALLGFFRAAFSVEQRRLAPDGGARLHGAGRGAAHPGSHGGGAPARGPLWPTRHRDRLWPKRGRGPLRGRRRLPRAPHVVCSLPFGVLRGIAVDPPFDGPAGGGGPRHGVPARDPGVLRAPLAFLGAGRLPAEHVHGRTGGHGGRLPERGGPVRGDELHRMGDGAERASAGRPPRGRGGAPGPRGRRGDSARREGPARVRGAQVMGSGPVRPGGLGLVSGRERSTGSRRRWAARTARSGSAASTSPAPHGAWRAPWSPASGPPATSSPPDPEPVAVHFGRAGRLGPGSFRRSPPVFRCSGTGLSESSSLLLSLHISFNLSLLKEKRRDTDMLISRNCLEATILL